MAHDPAAFADMVTLTVKAALAPLLERVASLDARVTQAQALEPSVATLRDRVVVIETKAAAPVVAAAPVDLTPLLERLAATEARVARLAAVELSVGELHDKWVTLETKASMAGEADVPLVADVEGRLLHQMDILRSDLRDVQNTVRAVEVKAAMLEIRPLVPGPAGPAGQDGAPGLNGKDGADGISLDDLSIVEEADERTLTIRGTVGTHTKDLGTLKFPWMINRGVYVNGNSYDRGDVVACGGLWHANETTARKPGDGSKAWTLIVRPGRDGRDGKDAETVPVVALGGGRR